MLKGVRLTAFALLLLLVACGGSGSSGGNNQPPGSNPPGNNPPPDGAAPAADAGDDFATTDLRTVTLDATASSDSDGSVLQFVWTQIDGTSVELTGADTATPSFVTPRTVAPETNVVTLRLTVTNGDGGSDTDDIAITVTEGTHALFIANKEHPDQHALYRATPGEEPVNLVADEAYGNAEGEAAPFAVTLAFPSPDGKYVAYEIDTDDNNESDALYISSIDGKRRLDLSSGGVRYWWGHAWSPDSQWLAFIGMPPGEDVTALYVVSPHGDGTPLRVSGTHEGVGSVSAIVQGDGTVWSTDSQHLLFIGDVREPLVEELFVTTPRVNAEPVLVSGALAAGQNVQQARWTPHGAGIVFTANINSALRDELFVVAADGTGRTLISGAYAGTADVTDMLWSPTGRHLAFHRTEPAGEITNAAGDLLIATFDEAGEWQHTRHILGDQANDVQVKPFFTRWAPDGSRVAFVADAAGYGDTGGNEIYNLYTALADGPLMNYAVVSGPASESGESAGGYAWSPSSDRLAFYRWTPDSWFELFTTAAEHSIQRVRLTSPSYWSFGGFQWSPDGSRIAMTLSEAGGTFHLFSAPATSDELALISGSLEGSVASHELLWSPDGERVAFQADFDEDGDFDLYYGAGTGGAEPVQWFDIAPVNGDGIAEMQFAPDSSGIFVQADAETRETDELYWVPVSGAPLKVSGAIAAGADDDSTERDVTWFEVIPSGQQ